MEILTALYFGGVLKVDPKCPQWQDRDRLVLSKGHASGTLCVILAAKGFFPKELLVTYNQMNSPFGTASGHEQDTRDRHRAPVPWVTGYPSRSAWPWLRDWITVLSGTLFAVLGDAEIQSGMTYEAAMAAGQFRAGFPCDDPGSKLDYHGRIHRGLDGYRAGGG